MTNEKTHAGRYSSRHHQAEVEEEDRPVHRHIRRRSRNRLARDHAPERRQPSEKDERCQPEADRRPYPGVAWERSFGAGPGMQQKRQAQDEKGQMECDRGLIARILGSDDVLHQHVGRIGSWSEGDEWSRWMASERQDRSADRDGGYKEQRDGFEAERLITDGLGEGVVDHSQAKWSKEGVQCQAEAEREHPDPQETSV